MEVMQNCNEKSLDCDRCSFHGNDYESVQIHMGSIHPEFCDEMDTAGLGKLVFYQKSARLFHCHRCFFTSKMFCNVYYHIIARHGATEKWESEEKPMVETKSESASAENSGKHSETGASEDEKSIDEQEQKDKLSEAEKIDENETLSSWPEKVPKQENLESSDNEFKSCVVGKVTEQFLEPKEKESSSDQDLESQSNCSSTKLSKTNSVHAKESIEFSDNEAASSHSKDIPDFSDDDETPALPDGLPHFSEDEETVMQPKDLEESSEDEVPAQSQGIEDISEDEIPVEERAIENVSEDEASLQQKELLESSDEEEVAAPVKEMMEFSEEEEDAPPLPKDMMDFSEDEEEPSTIPKNIMEFSEEEDESSVAAKNIMEFSEEETTNISKNIMEFSEEEETPALSKDIMEFSEEEDTPAMPKSIMEFSEEEDNSPHSKDMPKYLEGNSTPTQLKDNLDDVDSSALKVSSSLSEDDEIPDESNFAESKDVFSHSQRDTTPTHLSGTLAVSEDEGTSSWAKDLLGTPEAAEPSSTALDTPDPSDDKDGFIKDEEIMKHVRRAKGKFYCLLCECRPLKKGPVLHHLITRHNMPSPFVCKTCGKTFVMETHLKNHLASHTKGLYKCLRCNFQTDHPRGFKKHQTHCQRCHKDNSDQTVLDFQEQGKEEN